MTNVAVLSDTHGMLRREVVAEIQDCAHIIHAGDIVKETDLDELRLYGSIYAVRGNNDLWQEGLRDLAAVLRFRIEGVSFLMAHDRYDIPRDLDRILLEHDWDAEYNLRESGRPRDVKFISCMGLATNKTLMGQMRRMLRCIQEEYD